MIALLVACATARGPVTPVASLCGAEPAQAAEPVALPPLRVCPAGEPAWTLFGGGSCADSQCATWFVRSDAGGRCLDDRALGASHTAHYRHVSSAAGEAEYRCQMWSRVTEGG